MSNIRPNKIAVRGTPHWHEGMKQVWRGFMHHLYQMGYPKDYETMPRGSQINYERGRCLAAALRSRGLLKEVKDYKDVLRFVITAPRTTSDRIFVALEDHFQTKHQKR